MGAAAGSSGFPTQPPQMARCTGLRAARAFCTCHFSSHLGFSFYSVPVLPAAKASRSARSHQDAPPQQRGIGVPVSIRWRNRSVEIKLPVHSLRPL